MRFRGYQYLGNGKTKENPADSLSRRMSIEYLALSNLWWHGPIRTYVHITEKGKGNQSLWNYEVQ